MPTAKITTPEIRDFRPFLGYGPDDYERAKEFYIDLGFTRIWDSDVACEYDTGIGHRFLVTLHHGLDRDRAGMLHFWVENVDDWQAYLEPKKLADKYPGVKLAEPSVTDWGWRILYVWDPGGYLLHFAEPHTDMAKQAMQQRSKPSK